MADARARKREADVAALLLGPTPDAWIDAALADLPTLLLDHAECEKKAAGSALSLMYRYADQPALCAAASRFAREELRHYEMVVALLRKRGIAYRRLPPSAYAGRLRGLARDVEPGRLLDTLLIAAVIEARSWERFGRLAGRLQTLGAAQNLADFYTRLLASEARHAATYLSLADAVDSADEASARIAAIARLEWQLINAPCAELRFHSGVPAAWLR